MPPRFRLPSQRHLVNYGAIGAATATIGGLSYLLRSPWIWSGRNLDSPSSSSEQHQQVHRASFGIEMLDIRHWLGWGRSKELSADRHQRVQQDIEVCRRLLATNVASGSSQQLLQQLRPSIELRGSFQKADLARFEAEAFRLRRLLMNLLLKFQSSSQPKETEEEVQQQQQQQKESLLRLTALPDLLLEKSEEEKEEEAQLERMSRVKGAKTSRLYQQYKERNLAKRTSKLVHFLALQSELESPDYQHPLLVDFPRLLLDAVDRFRPAGDEKSTVAALKTLANSVGHSRECAQLVVRSEWLPLLHSMLTEPVFDEERVLAHKIVVNALHALGAEQTLLPPHIYELHRPSEGETAKLDIIFVHGLRGSVFHTWRQRDEAAGKRTRFWPKDWLATDLREPVRILALDYTTAFSIHESIGQGRDLTAALDTLEARAARFQAEFHGAGIGQRPLLFICHSMGGLLVKRILIENASLLDRTLGILFVATPHRGSPLASQFAYNFLRPTEDVRWLRTENPENRALNERFTEESRRIPLICTVLECEKTPIKRVGPVRLYLREPYTAMLVPAESALFGRGTVYHLGEHHHHVCKPVDRRSPFYAIVLNFVNDALRHLKEAERLLRMEEGWLKMEANVERRLESPFDLEM